MRILQLPTEIAGQVHLTAKGLRAIGYDAANVSKVHPFGYPVDINPCFASIPGLRRTRNPFRFGHWLREYDIFHYHKSPCLPGGLDVRHLRRLGRPFFVEFWGSDIRIARIEAARNRFFVGDISDKSRSQIRRLRFWSEMTDEVIMSDNASDIFLKTYFRAIHVVRQRVDTEAWTPAYPDPETRRPKVVHAPSNRTVKGTLHVERAVEALKKAGLSFDYVTVENMPHSEAKRIYAEADIIVDQLTIGSHGVFACEAMALGKPVICYITPELIDTYPEGFPIVNANPETIQGVLEELILSPERRYEIGVASRNYAEQVHDIRVVAKRLASIYNSPALPCGKHRHPHALDDL